MHPDAWASPSILSGIGWGVCFLVRLAVPLVTASLLAARRLWYGLTVVVSHLSSVLSFACPSHAPGVPLRPFACEPILQLSAPVLRVRLGCQVSCRGAPIVL